MRQFHRSHQAAGQHDFYRSKAKKLAKSAKAKDEAAGKDETDRRS